MLWEKFEIKVTSRIYRWFWKCLYLNTINGKTTSPSHFAPIGLSGYSKTEGLATIFADAS